MANFPESAQSPEESQGDSIQKNYPVHSSSKTDDFDETAHTQGRQWVRGNDDDDDILPASAPGAGATQGGSSLSTVPQSGGGNPSGNPPPPQPYGSQPSGGGASQTGGGQSGSGSTPPEESAPRRGDRVLLGVLILLVVVCSAAALLFLADKFYTLPVPETSRVASPANGLNTALNVPVAIQSFHPSDVSRVELWVKHEKDERFALVQADVPDENGQLLQLWTPLLPGAYIIDVKPVDFDNNNVTDEDSGITRTIVVVDSPAVRVPKVGETPVTPQPDSDMKQVQFVSEPLAVGFNPPAVPTPSGQCTDPGIAALRVNVQVLDENGDIVPPSPGKQGGQGGETYEIQKDEHLTFLVEPALPVADFSVTIFPPRIQPLNENDDFQIIPEPIPVPDVEPGKPFVFPAKTTGVHVVRVESTDGDCVQIQDAYVDVQGNIPVPVTPPTPTPTPTPFYPPPPNAPGVPFGPLQAELPELMPPTCDAAEYVGVYIPPDNSQRVLITEPDEIPAKTVGGTLVTRAWSIQNTGTCTWGPGYELAFYGGRSMGSGGVAFESFFPSEPARRNTIVNGEQLIAPQGFPNEIANLELALVAPVTPGIHQSYWRMRNPQGVYFGPIVGVTLEVVRDCSFGNYGAPVINKFEILGVGNVYQPENPVDVDAILGQPVTLDWSISNAQSYEIVIKSPTGGTQNISTGNTTDRGGFVPTELGEYTITLYADNTPCTAIAVVFVDVKPPTDSETFFVVQVANVASADGVINVTWKRETDDADEYKLVAQRFERTKDEEDCSFVFEWPPRKCVPAWGEWKPSASGAVLPKELIGVQGQSLPAEVTGGPAEIQSATITVSANGQNETFNQGQQTSAQRTVGGPDNSEASANLTNVIWGLCPAGYNPSDPNNTVQYGIKYKMAALKNGELLETHPFSVPVDKLCDSTPAPLNTEIMLNDASSSGGTTFNPGQ